MTSLATAGIRITLIGPCLIPEFVELNEWLRKQPDLTIAGHLSEIPQSAEQLRNSHIILVLQSYSDQFGSKTVNRLIEQTLGQRLFCCFGPLCASDGRCHDIWPVGLRIPVASFADYLQRERKLIAAGQPPLPPTASGEELFARWYGPDGV